ncbi:MAG: GntR family transcriptional regulator [Eubacteriales bacterium]|nr:GntR family transcriptional regulator [Eubacteriales bacterium]
MEQPTKIILPTRKETLVDVVRNKIMETIIQGDVSEESVLTEGNLVQQFGVSKATVREALVHLCSENILKSMPRYGYVLVRMGDKECEDINQFRFFLEAESLKKAFDQIGEKELAELRELLRQHQESDASKVWDIWKKNIEFHSLLVSFCHNQVCVEYLQRAMQRQSIYFGQFRWTGSNTFDDHLNADPHNDIYQSMCKRDLEQTLELLHKDIFWKGMRA